MKFSLAAVAFAALATAQSITDIPQCARDCLTKAVASDTSCASNDFACICENVQSIQESGTSCVLSACGADVARNKVLPAIEKVCRQAARAKRDSLYLVATPPPVAPVAPVAATPAASTVDVTVTTTECPSTSLAAPVRASTPLSTPTPTPVAGAASLGSVGVFAMLALGVLAL